MNLTWGNVALRLTYSESEWNREVIWKKGFDTMTKLLYNIILKSMSSLSRSCRGIPCTCACRAPGRRPSSRSSRPNAAAFARSLSLIGPRSLSGGAYSCGSHSFQLELLKVNHISFVYKFNLSRDLSWKTHDFFNRLNFGKRWAQPLFLLHLGT